MENAKEIVKKIGEYLMMLLSWLWTLLRRAWKIKVGRYVILITVALLTLLLFLLIYNPSHRRWITLEAGEALPDPVTLTDHDDAKYKNADVFQSSVPGEYALEIDTNEGVYYVSVKVRDTVAPEATVEARNWAVGMVRPEAIEFFSKIVDETAVTAEYVDDNNTYTAMDSYPVKLVLTDAGGNRSYYETTVTLIEDVTPPTVTKQELSGCIGYGILYSKGVIATDDCCGALTVDWDSSKVDTNTPGEYPVYYTVSDASGNVTKLESTIYIYEQEVNPAELQAQIDEILKEIITPSMNNEARVRAVYEYVYDHISYTGTSDKSDWMRAAYQSLQTGDGDCFSYFALAKAFFEQLGLENLDIQRTLGLTEDRHYWNMVNIGTREEPRWYYFDATHLNSQTSGVSFSGALLTEQQIRAFSKVRAHFYTFDHTGYPEAATEEITPTPDLKPYY